jgi:2-dehydropantoate 2-reductase
VSYSRVEEIARALNDAGIPTLPTGEIEKHIWGKILYNSTLNPLSAILNATFGELAAEPATREIMSRVADEIFQVAPGRGVELFWKRPQEYLDLFYEQLIPPTAGHYASMLEDLKRGSRTEIESLNGAIVRYGHELNVLCPVNEVLTNIIRVMEQVYGKPFDETKM